eukprot:Blabericola_migrator_1__4953@NODE_257_length_10777_cov_171_650047_g215_i0_p1_GENE_NODE_257_length_10777_cov_171_650047_g215_i0NODE_257_length_10777_cov_171_650047_g215_i0_p1_ORF_typecomplete_len602_score73_54AA_kinase/PF00696_28/5_7e36PUA/PF01472_20/2_3e14_NODE_257_length_10777_cov_171_650047_g215_i035645369
MRGTMKSSPKTSMSDFHGSRHEDLSQLLTQPPTLPDRPDGSPAQILVLKVGTSTLMDPNKNCFSLSNLGKFVDAVCDLKDRGYHVVMISSGAVGSGCVHMHMNARPTKMVEKQAISAIGQCRIVRLWEDIFAIREKKVAQLLLTRTDLIDRPRFVNFRNTLLQLLCMDVIPIINENDALATEGLKFGDNDTLGAYVSVSIGANWYFMLTDVDCLYTANPRYHEEARPIAYVGKIDTIYNTVDERENAGTQWGSGGMRTKIIAAKLCCATGIHTALCHGAHPERILDIAAFAEAGAVDRTRSRKCGDAGGCDTGKECASGGCYPVKPLSQKFVASLQKASQGGTNTNVAERKSTAEFSEGGTDAAQLTDTVTTSMPSGERVSSLDTEEDESHGDAPHDELPSHKRVAFITFPSIALMPYLGTIFAGQPCTQSLRDQRRWILSLPVRGRIYVDENCARAVIEKRKSLFAAGIVSVKDEFYPGEAVALHPAPPKGDKKARSEDDREEIELARCLVNFSSEELEKIKGKRTCEFQYILGYYCAHEVAHRSNIIFVNPSPVYERYQVKITQEMVQGSDDEDEVAGLDPPAWRPVPVPVEGGESHEL